MRCQSCIITILNLYYQQPVCDGLIIHIIVTVVHSMIIGCAKVLYCNLCYTMQGLKM